MFTVLSKPGCGHCTSAKAALEMKGLDYTEVMHIMQDQIEDFLAKGFRTFPQVFHDEKHIGGNRQLQEYLLENF